MGYNKKKRAEEMRKRTRRHVIKNAAVQALLARHQDQRDPRSNYAREMVYKHAGIPAHADALEWMKQQIEKKEYRYEDLVPVVEVADNTINPDILIRMMILNSIAPNRYSIPEEMYTKVRTVEDETSDLHDKIVEAVGEGKEMVPVVLPNGEEAILVASHETVEKLKDMPVTPIPEAVKEVPQQVLEEGVAVDPSVVNTDGVVHATHAEITTDADGQQHVMLVGDKVEDGG